MRLLIAAVFLASSCSTHFNPHERPAGGPCTYETMPAELQVVKTVVIDSASGETEVYVVNRQRFADTLRLSYLLMGKTLYRHDVEANGLYPGKRIYAEVDQIISGTCVPEVYHFADSTLKF